MNTTQAGMRTALAAAAAGALILGSAGGVVAEPDKAPGPNKSTVQTETKLRTINIKRHKVIDLAAPPKTIKLRAKVWNPDREGENRTVALTLGVFTKKVAGKPFMLQATAGAAIPAPDSNPVDVPLLTKDTKKKVKRYRTSAMIVGEDEKALWTAEQIKTLKTALEPGDRAYICIKAVDVSLEEGEELKYSTQVKKRLGELPDGKDYKKKKTVRDCVRVIDSSTDES